MRRRGIFIGVAVAVIVSIVFLAFMRFDVNSYRAQIQTEIEQRLGRKVTLGNLKLKLVPLRLRVDNLVVSDDPDFAQHSPFLKADTADLSVRLVPLLRHKVDIKDIDLLRPTVELVKSAKGVWNFSSIGHAGMHGNVTLHDGQVAVTNQQWGNNRKIYDHIDLHLLDFAPDKPFSIDLVAQQVRLDGKVGPLSERPSFDGTLKMKRMTISGLASFFSTPILAKTEGMVSGETDVKTDDGKLSAVGRVKLENLVLNGVAVGYPVSGEYHLAADPLMNVITIGSSTIDLGTAPMTVSGSFNLRPTPEELDLRIESKDASVAEVTRLAAALGVAFAPDTTATGKLTADLQVRGPYNNPAMNGTVSVRDLRIMGKDVPQPVQVATLDLAITPTEIRSNNFEIRSGSTTAAVNFGLGQYTSKSPTIAFALRSANANLPEVLAMARSYGVKGLAGINGSGTLNLDVHASGSVKAVGSAALLSLLNGNVSMNLSNIRVAGLDVEHELKSIGGFKKSTASRGGTDIQHLTGHFVFINGVAQTNDLRAVLHLGNVAAAGTINLSNHALNLRATAVLSKAASEEVAGGSITGALTTTVLGNSRGELVIPGMVKGTLENPKFEPDMEQLSLMKLKGIVPTADNPFGVLGTLLGQVNHNGQKPSRQEPLPILPEGVDKMLGRFLGGKK